MAKPKNDATENALPGYQTLRAHWQSLPPGLLMDNGDRADPIDELSQAIHDLREGTNSKQRNAHYYQQLSSAEFIGSLYTTEPGHLQVDGNHEIQGVEGGGWLALPSELIFAVLVETLGKQARGRRDRAKLALSVPEPFYPLLIEGQPMDASEAFGEYARLRKRLRVRNLRKQWVIKTLSLFPEWQCDVAIDYRPQLIGEKDMLRALVDAGATGIGTGRSRNYGRFDSKIL